MNFKKVYVCPVSNQMDVALDSFIAVSPGNTVTVDNKDVPSNTMPGDDEYSEDFDAKARGNDFGSLW
ncbi:MAG: hypothetical protein K6E54_06140 [Bacteroidaceae bacterium]|jgi:hypothetical protein|nr:hypothetical protein [Bacteroidaceae bacterium]